MQLFGVSVLGYTMSYLQPTYQIRLKDTEGVFDSSLRTRKVAGGGSEARCFPQAFCSISAGVSRSLAGFYDRGTGCFGSAWGAPG